MNLQAPSDRWGMEISHYEKQISLLFWFLCICRVGKGGHETKCGISEINLKRSYTLKNSSSVWLVEGKCVSLSIADFYSLPILAQNCLQTVVILARCLFVAPTSSHFSSFSPCPSFSFSQIHTCKYALAHTDWVMHAHLLHPSAQPHYICIHPSHFTHFQSSPVSYNKHYIYILIS